MTRLRAPYLWGSCTTSHHKVHSPHGQLDVPSQINVTKVSDPFVQTMYNSYDLSLVPAELMTKIYGALPSFHDVFALAATCRPLRQIFIMKASPIYRHVAPKCIPCERYARRLLADQGGPAIHCPILSAGDVRSVVQNSCVVGKAILQFEKEIVFNVKRGSAHGQDI